jgi:hypothetical protein
MLPALMYVLFVNTIYIYTSLTCGCTLFALHYYCSPAKNSLAAGAASAKSGVPPNTASRYMSDPPDTTVYYDRSYCYLTNQHRRVYLFVLA